MNKLHFIATPYYDPDDRIRETRYLEAMSILHDYVRKGKSAYSPIVHCHELAKRYNLRLTASDWWRFNYPFLVNCDVFVVGKLPGWTESDGLNSEWNDAKQLRKEIEFYDPYSQ